MKPKRITYAGEEHQKYIPPVLFPRIGHFVTESTRREYVRQTMMRMAGYYESEQGELLEPDTLTPLCLTEMIAQPSRISNLCGRIVFGITIDDETHRETRAEPLPAKIMAQQVHIKCINGRNNICFKRRVVDDPRQMRRLPALQGGGDITHGGLTINKSPFVKKMVPEVWDFQAAEADLDLEDAWVCLSKAGEHCRPCPQAKQAKYWHYQEVDEDGDPMIDWRKKQAAKESEETVPEQARRGPGRPRKQLQT